MDPATPTLSDYEREALEEIAETKNPQRAWTSKLANKVHKPVDRLGDAAFDTAVGEKLAEGLAKVLSAMQQGAAWSVREKAILEDFDGNLASFSDIAALPLEHVDDAARGLARKYRIAATVEGSVVGSVGALGMVADVPLILGMALRGTCEFAAYYGFYPFSAAERSYALDLISCASAPTLEKRQANLAALDARSAVNPTTHHEVGAVLTIQVVERVTEAIITRLAQGKVAQTVPIVGALIGGGFNRWFIGQVMSLAEAMYRERFLVRKHGASLVIPTKAFEGL